MPEIKSLKENLGTLNILSLLLKELIASALKKNPALENYIKNKTLKAGIKAGKMSSTIIIKNGEIYIDNSVHRDCNCVISGTLDGFLEAGIRKNPLPLILKGKLRAKGNLFKLKPLIKIFGELRV